MLLAKTLPIIKCDRLFIHLCSLCLELLVVDIVVILHQLVDSALWSKLDDAVCHGLYELVVVATEEDVSLEAYEVVVESLDTFKVKVVEIGRAHV